MSIFTTLHHNCPNGYWLNGKTNSHETRTCMCRVPRIVQQSSSLPPLHSYDEIGKVQKFTNIHLHFFPLFTEMKPAVLYLSSSCKQRISLISKSGDKSQSYHGCQEMKLLLCIFFFLGSFAIGSFAIG